MDIYSYSVLSRHKENMMFPANITDFQTEMYRKEHPSILLEDPYWTLYCLDIDTQSAVFVKTPIGIDLTTESFLFQAQFLHATKTIQLSFESLHELANEINVDSKKIVFVHSVGRCGSTLLSQVLSRIDQVCSISEHDPATHLTEWRTCKSLTESELKRLLASSTKLCLKQWPSRPEDQYFAFKYRAQCIELADWLMQSFPNAKQLFLKRDPLDWINSIFRTFVDPNAINDPEYQKLIEKVWANQLPFIQQQRIPESPMNIFQTWMCVWIAFRKTQQKHVDSGYSFHEIEYKDLKEQPLECMQSILNYCGIPTSDWSEMRKCLERDSQGGTTIAREKIKKRNYHLPREGLIEAKATLQKWGF